jgi:tryptophan-rich sensory protein
MQQEKLLRQNRHWPALCGFLALTLAVGALAGFATARGVEGWYASLLKPSFNPPDWVFAPVWTFLYVLMAIAAWRVWRICGLLSTPLILFFVQLALNFAWSFIFFSAHLIALAFAEIVILLATILCTVVSFRRVDRFAAALLLPYAAWVTFATLLTAEIYTLN